MEKTETYESFPTRIAVLSILTAWAIYGLGAYLLSSLSLVWAILYLIYCAGLEVWVLKSSCVSCYYYGKVCGLEKGKLCSLLFPKGDPRRFAEKEASWVQMLPNFLVMVFPMVGGIVGLVRDFSWVFLGALALFVLLSFGGNVVIRGSFACKHCKQRELGCPAEKVFRKK